MSELDVTALICERLGVAPGRIMLPGVLQAYDEQRAVEEVTPLQAMTWIAQTWERYSNGRNFYPTKLSKIKLYAALMSAGEWEYREDGDTIDITDGIVTGGRHRLHAILLSHTTQKFNVLHRTTRKS